MNTTEERKNIIQGILAQGKHVRFTLRNVIKDVDKWELDADGDLKAYASTGKAPYIYWEATPDQGGYIISSIEIPTWHNDQ